MGTTTGMAILTSSMITNPAKMLPNSRMQSDKGRMPISIMLSGVTTETGSLNFFQSAAQTVEPELRAVDQQGAHDRQAAGDVQVFGRRRYAEQTGHVRQRKIQTYRAEVRSEGAPVFVAQCVAAEIVDEAHQHLCGNLLSPGTLAQSVRQPDGKQGQHNYDRPTYHSGFRNRYSAKQRNLERNMGLQFGIQFRFDFTQRASPRLSIEVGLRAYCKNLSEFTQAYETKKKLTRAI